MPTNFLKILVLTAHEMYIVLYSPAVLWWKTKKGVWHRSRKKGKREAQHSGRNQKQTGWCVLGDITKASWLKIQNRHRTGLSEWWCCQKSHKNLDWRAAILYFKCKGGFWLQCYYRFLPICCNHLPSLIPHCVHLIYHGGKEYIDLNRNQCYAAPAAGSGLIKLQST